MRRTASLRVSAALALGLAAASPARAQISGTVADFTFSPAAPRAGETVTFTDKSVGSVFGWYWSFGDGTTSGLQNPTHAYTAPGVYEVTLAVLDRSLQEASVTKVVSVGASGTAAADFVFDPVFPGVGETVRFTDRSSGTPTAWSWDFGDGGTSTQQSPTHAYGAAGSFAVRLTATTSSGSSSVTKTVVVRASAVVAAFAFFPQNPAVGDQVAFQNLSEGSPTSFSWSFGDGGTSTESDPTYTYSSAGTFQVSLTASTAGASHTATQAITVAEATAGDFSVKVLSVVELPSETTNGNGKPEPGERIGVTIGLTNGTTRTESSVVAQLMPWTWNAPSLVDMIDFGTVPSGAALALADGRFEMQVDPSYPCDAHIDAYVRLFLAGGRVTDALQVDIPLPNGTTCDPPLVAVPGVAIDEPPEGTSYAIGSGVALAYTIAGSQGTEGSRVEISRDGGATWEFLTPEPPTELTGVGPHIYSFRATPPTSARVRFRVSVALAGGGTISAVTSRDVAFVEPPGGTAAAHLPVVVQGPGASQSYFTTDATIASPDAASSVLLTFTPIGGTPMTIPDPIPVPKGSRYLPDVFQPFRDNGLVDTGVSLVGTLTATAGGKLAPLLTARVTNIPRSGVGSFGLAFASSPEGMGTPREAWVSGMITSSVFRSNLSLAHVRGGSGAPITLLVELWDGTTGKQVAGSPRAIVLPPDGFAQINNFQGFTVEQGVPYQYRVTKTAGDDQFRAYGTIIDAVTGDPSYVEGANVYGDTGEHTIQLASVVEAQGLYGSFFTSDVTIVNRSATSSATVSLRLDAQGAWEQRSAFVLGPRQGRVLKGIVDWFRQRGAAFSGTVVGPLKVSFSGGDGAVLVRTSSPARTPAGVGSYGLAFAGRRTQEMARASALLTGVRKSGSFRSNLALVHGGTAGPITLTYRLHAALDGTTYGPATKTLQPGEFFQAGDVVGTLGAPAGFYNAVVTRTAGTDAWDAYLTILDNVTNDGSFVEMVVR